MEQILGIIGNLLPFLKPLLDRLRRDSKRTSTNESLPKQTLTLVADPMKTGLWANGPLAMVHVNNISDKDVKITSVFLIRGRKVHLLRKPKVPGWVVVQNSNGIYDGKNRVIPGGETREARLEFRPVLPHRENETFRADIMVIDQFNNKHLVKGVEFKQKNA